MESSLTDVPGDTEPTEGGDDIVKDENIDATLRHDLEADSTQMDLTWDQLEMMAREEDVKNGGATGDAEDNDGNEPNKEASDETEREGESNAEEEQPGDGEVDPAEPEEQPDDAEEQPAEPEEQPDDAEIQPDVSEEQPDESEQPEDFNEQPVAAEENGDDVGDVGGDLFGGEETTREEEDENTDDKATKSPAPAELEGEDETKDETNGPDEAVPLSDEDRDKCHRLFEKKAVNGRLNLTGLKAVFRLMGQILSSSDADQIFDQADKDNDNSIDFEEFCRLYSKFGQEEEARQSVLLTSVDRLFKCNQNGEVELKEVEQVLLQLQQPGPNGRLLKEKSDLCPEDIRSLVKKMDKDGNGRISKREFVSKLCQHVEV